MKPIDASKQKPMVRVQKLDLIAQRRRLTACCWGLSLVLIVSLGVIRSAQAEAAKYHADIFVPNSLFFSAQKSTVLNQSLWLANLSRGADNEALLQIADDVRANNMSSEQRILNYQWLGQQHDRNVEYDGGAISALLKLGLQAAWDQLTMSDKARYALPDARGRGTFNFRQHSFDYKLRLSGGDLAITLNYEF